MVSSVMSQRLRRGWGGLHGNLSVCVGLLPQSRSCSGRSELVIAVNVSVGTSALS